MGLIYNATTGKVEYLIDLEGGSNGPITINFAYMQDTQPNNPQEKDVWFDTANNKIYTYKNGQWVESDPQVGVFYSYNDQYYLWDGNSLETTDLNIYEKIENKTDNFTEDNSIKYPSSKALKDGLKSVEPNLYDIRTLSQAIANKGWASMSKTTRQDLPKADVPTVYNDILTKYRNCDNAPSSSYVQLPISECRYNTFCFDDTYFYGTTNPNQDRMLKRSPISLFPSIVWESTPISTAINSNGGTQNNRYFSVGDNLIVIHNNIQASVQPYYEEINIYKKSDFSLYKTIRTKYQKDSWIYLLNIDGVKTFYIFYANPDDNNYTLVTLVDSETAEFDTIRTDLGGGIGLPSYDNGTFIFFNGADEYISKTTDNFRTITQITKFSYNYSHSTLRDIFKIGNNMVCCCGNGRLSGTQYSTDNGQTWQYYSGLGFTEINNGAWCDGETFYGCCYDDGGPHLYKSTNLLNFTKLIPSETISGAINVLDNPSTIFFQDGYTIKYLGVVKTVYTDTYIVNGANVNINYYKYDDWKICLPNGTNDTNLDTVYNFLGYLNYWRLNETNETITLPRNSNLYSMMYVGDNYQDILTGISGNATRLLPQSNVVEDTTSTAISFSSSNQVQPNTDYEYGELTTLTFGSSSVNYSLLGTTIMFTSGATATVLTDSASIDWVDGAKPEPSASKTCLIFIWKNKGFYKEW